MVIQKNSDIMHKTLIRSMIRKLESENYTVQADHIGYNKEVKEEWGGEKPDIYAYKGNNSKVFIEAITKDNINSKDLKKRLEILSGKSEIEFWIITTKDFLDELKNKLKEWNILYDRLFFFEE